MATEMDKDLPDGRLEEALDEALHRLNCEIEDLSSRVPIESSHLDESLSLVFGPESHSIPSQPSALHAKLQRAYGVEILKLKAMMEKNINSIEDLFEGKVLQSLMQAKEYLSLSSDNNLQEIASRVEQVVILNHELSSCVEQLDEFVIYLKSCFDESRADMLLEQDLLDEMNFINAGLDLWKNRCISEEGGSKVLQDELAFIQYRNGKLVYFVFLFASVARHTSQQICRHKKCRRLLTSTSQSNQQMSRIFREKRVSL